MFELMGDIEGDPERVFVRRGDRYFRVGRAVWAALDRFQGGGSRTIVNVELGRLYPLQGHGGSEHPALKAADRLLASVDDEPARPRMIAGRLEVDVSGMVAPVARYIRPILFYPRLVVACILLLIGMNLLAYVGMSPGRSAHPALDALLIAAAMFGIMSLHELGHAAVATALGCRSHRIGLGLFFVLPVFYADVSEIWRLRPYKRVLVNLAGVFVQLVIGLGIASFAQAGIVGADFLRSLFVINLLSIAVNLLPFAKLDGYWIVSDILDVPDLQLRGWARLKSLFGAGGSDDAGARSTAVQIYALGLFLFAGFVLWRLSGGLLSVVAMVAADPYHGLDAAFRAPAAWLVTAYLVLRVTRALAMLVRARTARGAVA
jgi:Zn-dependent protease